MRPRFRLLLLPILACAGVSAWGAAAWRTMEFTEPAPLKMKLSACKGDSLWVTTPDGMQFSEDGGATWLGGWPIPEDTTGLCQVPAVFQGDTFTTSRKTLSQGYVWRRSGKDSVLVLDFRGIFANLVVTSKGLLAVTRDGTAFLSGDGRTWNPVSGGTRFADIRGLAANGSTLAAQTSLGLYLSRDRGRHWEYLRPALPGVDVPRLLLTRDYLFICDYAKSFIRYDLARSAWDSLAFPGMPEPFGFTAGNEGIVYGGAGPEGRGLYFSKDGAGFKKTGSFPSALFYAMAVQRGDIVLVGRDSLFRTSDSGANWTGTHPGCLDVGLETVATDSGVFVLDPYGLKRITPPKGCGDFRAPTIIQPYGTRREVDGSGFHIAGDGSSLYLSDFDGLWVWEDPETTGLRRLVGAAAHPREFRSPVRVWNAPPSSGRGWIDAKGAIRKE